MAPRLNPEVIARRLGDGAVLVHLPTSRIFELNETAMRVWELFAEGLDVPAIVACVEQEYEASRGSTGAQIAHVLETFRDEGLIA